MSVYFEAGYYSLAFEQMKEFECALENKICQPMGLSISKCSIDNALMFMHLNCAGEMKQYDHASLIAHKEDWKNAVFLEIADTAEGKFDCQGKSGLCFLGKIFPNAAVDVNNVLTHIEGNVQYTIDFQNMSNLEREMFDYELGKQYNCTLSEMPMDIVNLTYLISILLESDKERDNLKSQMIELFDKNGILLLPCSGREKEAFYSICSLGTMDFHSMRNASVNFASSLLL